MRADRLADLLVALRKDRAVWSTLGQAMAAATKIAADGQDQSFGLRQIDAKAVVKQGSSLAYSMVRAPAQLNTTGFVDNGRFAVVIMVRGPHAYYFAHLAAIVSAVTKLVFT